MSTLGVRQLTVVLELGWGRTRCTADGYIQPVCTDPIRVSQSRFTARGVQATVRAEIFKMTEGQCALTNTFLIPTSS